MNKNYKELYHFVRMKKPSSMGDDEFRKLAAVVNNKGLGGRGSGFSGFDEAFYTILTLYANQPERLGVILDEFLYNYAHAFWDMPKSVRNNGAGGPQGVP